MTHRAWLLALTAALAACSQTAPASRRSRTRGRDRRRGRGDRPDCPGRRQRRRDLGPSRRTARRASSWEPAAPAASKCTGWTARCGNALPTSRPRRSRCATASRSAAPGAPLVLVYDPMRSTLPRLHRRQRQARAPARLAARRGRRADGPVQLHEPDHGTRVRARHDGFRRDAAVGAVRQGRCARGPPRAQRPARQGHRVLRRRRCERHDVLRRRGARRHVVARRPGNRPGAHDRRPRRAARRDHGGGQGHRARAGRRRHRAPHRVRHVRRSASRSTTSTASSRAASRSAPAETWMPSARARASRSRPPRSAAPSRRACSSSPTRTTTASTATSSWSAGARCAARSRSPRRHSPTRARRPPPPRAPSRRRSRRPRCRPGATRPTTRRSG